MNFFFSFSCRVLCPDLWTCCGRRVYLCPCLCRGLSCSLCLCLGLCRCTSDCFLLCPGPAGGRTRCATSCSCVNRTYEERFFLYRPRYLPGVLPRGCLRLLSSSVTACPRMSPFWPSVTAFCASSLASNVANPKPRDCLRYLHLLRERILHDQHLLQLAELREVLLHVRVVHLMVQVVHVHRAPVVRLRLLRLRSRLPVAPRPLPSAQTLITYFPNSTSSGASPSAPSSPTLTISLTPTNAEMILPFSLSSGWGCCLICVWGLRM